MPGHPETVGASVMFLQVYQLQVSGQLVTNPYPIKMC